ncbi:unnamed protein product [Mycena citricolor]|uniref:Uncharacterized protein n=1 Tax=Mycena citricolor TaxID=2018698 RepID=A0AAD2GY91_9AGAR|nr:unnamed protein product [Mycena citricolor]CAK5280692.1 unnamed protein product [Mycena citricolor]
MRTSSPRSVTLVASPICRNQVYLHDQSEERTTRLPLIGAYCPYPTPYLVYV